MFLDLGSTSDLRDKFTVYVTFSLRAKVMYLNISVIPLSLPSDFREKLWVGLGRGRDWGRNVDPGSTKYVDPGPCLTLQNQADLCVT